jgi:hypothetical protein
MMVDRSDEKGSPTRAVDSMISPKKGFTGLFAGLDLPNMIQMLAMNGVSGRIRLQRGRDSGEVFLKGGEIVHAACGSATGIEGFRRLMSWEGGEIQVDPDALPERETIDIPWHALLIQTMATIEDQRAAPAAARAEEPSSPRAPQAAETFQLHTLYSHASQWSGVQNCLIYSVDRAEVVRPSVPGPHMQEWGKLFGKLLEWGRSLPPVNETAPPSMVVVTLQKRTWVLVSHNTHIVALEISRGVDVKELYRTVRNVLSEEV